MKVLHIVRAQSDERALASARQHQAEHEVTLLLLHDAARRQIDWGGAIFACREDAEGHDGGSLYPTLDYEHIVALVFAHDRVVAW